MITLGVPPRSLPAIDLSLITAFKKHGGRVEIRPPWHYTGVHIHTLDGSGIVGWIPFHVGQSEHRSIKDVQAWLTANGIEHTTAEREERPHAWAVETKKPPVPLGALGVGPLVHTTGYAQVEGEPQRPASTGEWPDVWEKAGQEAGLPALEAAMADDNPSPEIFTEEFTEVQPAAPDPREAAREALGLTPAPEKSAADQLIELEAKRVAKAAPVPKPDPHGQGDLFG